MNMALLKLLVIFTILVESNIVRMDLIVDKRCGQLSCDRHMYCSQIDLICKDCANICNKNHNYNSEACVKGCEDYLHDITYVRRDDEGPSNSLKDEVKQLRTTLIATLTLVVLILIGIIIVLSIQALKWCKNNTIFVQKLKNLIHHKTTEVTSADAKTISNPNARLGDEQPKPADLRLNITSSHIHSDLPTPATLSTNISRRPAEDSTLDYAAYDNPAMRRSGSNHEDSPCSVIGMSRDRMY